MSLIVTVFVREGIVMAADSRLTLDANTQQGNQQVVKMAVGLTDSVRKCFLAPGGVGIATYGAADIGGVPITGYIESFISEKLSGGAQMVDAIPSLLLDYFKQFAGPPATKFHVAGYKVEGGKSVQHVWRVDVAANTAQRFNDPTKQGAVWGGEADVLSRIISPLWSKDQAGNFTELPNNPIPWQFFTLQDAIDFASYAIRATIDTMRFQARPKTVGGPVDVLVLKPTETSWISHKALKVGSEWAAER